jgi:GNAT superfamily N-acetyltransferase
VAEHQVSPVALARWSEVSKALAAAFYEDPVMGWLLPDAGRRPGALWRFFAIETRQIVLAHGASVASADGDEMLGAALVLPPGRWRTPLRVQALYGPRYVQVFGARLPRALGVLTQMERRHPRAEHYYLPYIGVVAAAQGRGMGAAPLAPVLERCDRERMPAYLEASSPRSARLYRRLGFTTTDVITPLGSPPLELMWREPAR